MRTSRPERVHVLTVTDEQHGLPLDLDHPHLPGLDRVEGGDVVLMLRHGKLRPVWGPQADAEKRVDDAIARVKAAETKARQAANAARKAAAEFAIFTALALVIGAFIASAAAAYGGSLRDE
jgi:hypothetical protein